MTDLNKTLFSEDFLITSILTVADTRVVPFDPGPYTFPTHDVLAYLLEGESVLEFEEFPGEKFELSPGDIFFVPKGATYFRRKLHNYTHFIVVDFLCSSSEGEPLSPQVFHAPKGVDNLFKLLYKTWSIHGSGFYCSSMSTLYNIFASLISHHTKSYISKKTRLLLEDAQKSFAENFLNPEFSLEDFIDEQNISEARFREYFKLIYGMPPNQYLIYLRINRAKELLESSSLSVNEISRQLGFAYTCYFSRIFKSKTGLSPSEYQKIFRR